MVSRSKNRAASQPPSGSAPRWASKYSIHDDPPINDGKRLGKSRLRFDIQIERTGIGKHPKYGFEAKRLSGSDFGVSKYLDDEGLGAFVSAAYAAEEIEAGMIGYVQTDSEAEWNTKIEEGMKARKTSLKFCKDGEWRLEPVVQGLQFCFRTGHKRPSIGQDIIIYHLMLLFRGQTLNTKRKLSLK